MEKIKSPLIEFGPSVKISTFAVRNISEGNAYALPHILASTALRFLYKPEEIPRIRKIRKEDPLQLTVFGNSDSNNSVSSLGLQSEQSNSPYAINVFLPFDSFKLEGEKIFKKEVNLVGRFDEIIKNGVKDNIIRVRRNGGEPSITDAIYLGLDYIAYLATVKKRGLVPLAPDLSVFNSVENKNYTLKFFSDRFFNEIIKVLLFSDLALKAGFYPKDYEDKFVKIHLNPTTEYKKRLQLKNRKNVRQTLTADETFDRAKNHIKRLIGALPFTSPLFEFTEI